MALLTSSTAFHSVIFFYIYIYRFSRSPIVTSLLYVVPEADAKQLVAAPTKAKWKLAEVGKSDDIKSLTIFSEALFQLEKRLGGWTGLSTEKKVNILS